MTDFGRDTYCLDRLVPGRLSSGLALVRQAVYHRVTTPPNTVRTGALTIDLVEMVGSIMSDSDAASVPGRVRAAILEDERIADVAVELESSNSNGQITWTVTISCQSDEGPFDLVLAISGVTIELLGVAA